MEGFEPPVGFPTLAFKMCDPSSRCVRSTNYQRKPASKYLGVRARTVMDETRNEPSGFSAAHGQWSGERHAGFGPGDLEERATQDAS